MRSFPTFRTLLLGGALALAGAPLAAQPPQTTRPPAGQASADVPRAERRTHRMEKARRHRADDLRRIRHELGAAAFRGVTLTEAQRTQLRTLRERHRDEQRQLMTELRAAAPKVARSGAPVDSAARAQRRAEWRQAMQANAGRVRALHERELAEVRAILTPEQRATFDRNVARMRARATERVRDRGEARGVRGDRQRGARVHGRVHGRGDVEALPRRGG